MSRFFSSSVSLCALSIVMVGVTACQSAPVSSAPVEITQQAAVTSSPSSDLETRVSALEQQMKAAQPKLEKVDVMESHFKALSLDMARIAESYNAPVASDMASKEEVAPAPAPAPKPVPVAVVEKEKEAPKKEVEKKMPAASGKLSVTSVRIGEQPKEITRIVMDTTKPAEIRYDLDNGEGLLVIDVPGAGWDATQSATLKKSVMVKSFRASHDDEGAHLVVTLKQTAKVVATARLNPSGNSGNRVYVDIAPAK